MRVLDPRNVGGALCRRGCRADAGRRRSNGVRSTSPPARSGFDAGRTKNRDARVFPMTAALRTVLKAQRAEHDRLKTAGHIVPFVFVREVAEGRGGEKKPRRIVSFGKVWRAACVDAGCPGRIPHDLRRTAVRNLVRAGIPERVAMQMTATRRDRCSSATTSSATAT
jgi:integrase